ncbi:zinc-binding dehydrogenase [Streptomonospora nanhaiensis]|uniref:zinc-dependent alcohol dehydrogenase n=1 Tax=Streptomonospora nanhaiensis TaxID=1323731 RepID=UPI001C38134E|nr:alcohol dehydrogenase catalytic domain-containing protein [Streptomonospora nanhaiensis]MBV2365337.1 alcohol dehydrogenase catalytic domain-containing protein [Streptomonospora nanhaiensis]MBX9389438.1 alcohol dehydrogenase catalytic domain-containing protein [Streptomonospora nanhaiensis]
MRAWEVRAGALGLHDDEAARPGAGEVVLRVSHTGVCGSDTAKLLRPGDFALPEPWRPGHEVVGTTPAGEAAAVDPLVPCARPDRCDRCAAGDTHLCPDLRRLGWDLPGGFAERVAVPASALHPLPRGVDPLHAVLADPAAVAVHGLRCSPVGPPGRLAVVGAGPVGLLTALYAHRLGWRTTVVHRDGRAPGPALAAVLPAALRPRSAAREGAFDAVVDAASGGDAAPLETAIALVRDGGTVVVQNAYAPGVALPTPLRDLFRRSIRLVGSFSHCRRGPGDFPLALSLLADAPEAARHLVTPAGPLDALPTALTRSGPRTTRQALVLPE